MRGEAGARCIAGCSLRPDRRHAGRFGHGERRARKGAGARSRLLAIPGELSYEDPKLANGIFTHVVLRALTTREAVTNSDGVVDIRELAAYATATTAKLTGDRQHPTIDRDNRFVTFAFPILEPAKPAVPPVARGARGCGCASSGSPDAVAILIVALVWRRRRRAQ